MRLTSWTLAAGLCFVLAAQPWEARAGHQVPQGNSQQASASGWWDGQVRSFQKRWGLAPAASKRTSGSARSSTGVQTADYVRTAGRTPVQTAAHWAYGPNRGPYGPPSSPQVVAAPSRPQPSDPSTAGLAPGVAQLQAPLYPTPRPDIPYQVGGTVITNQAFSPHELLYPHEYRALYPPYYYKVHGGWVVTPWGVWSSDRWELQGTEVRVKYNPKISWLSAFAPPSRNKLRFDHWMSWYDRDDPDHW